MIETILSTATLFCAVLLILLITIWVVSYIKYGDGPLKSLESLTFRPSEDENCFPIFSEPELALVCRALSDSMNFATEDRFD